MQFTSLDDLIAIDDPVRIIDAFVDKLDLSQMGIKQYGNKRQIHAVVRRGFTKVKIQKF